MIYTAEEFVTLRESNDPKATHDSAPIAVWEAVIATYPEYKRWIVHNKTVPVSILRKLAGDTDPEVRLWVANKNKCTTDILLLLAKDEDEAVRSRVALNRSTPNSILKLLCNDSSEPVAEAAAKRLR